MIRDEDRVRLRRSWWWSIACKDRNELSFTTDVSAEESRHVGETGATLLRFSQSLISFAVAALRI